MTDQRTEEKEARTRLNTTSETGGDPTKETVPPVEEKPAGAQSSFTTTSETGGDPSKETVPPAEEEPEGAQPGGNKPGPEERPA